MSEEASTGSIRVMTWNIHGAVGFDGRCLPDRVLAAIVRHRPDILALQEIDGRSHLGRRPRAFEWAAEQLGPHIVEARLLRRVDQDYGHLLWSRWPVKGATVRILPGGRREVRAVIDAVVETPTGSLRVLGAHFGLMPGDRKRQSAVLATLVGEATTPVLAMGDFNDWRLSGSVHRALRADMPGQVTPRTWPAIRPLARMDRIYASGGIAIIATSVDATAWRASDHLPVIADIRLPPMSGSR